jgi:general L-amino acid transport system substrate-binding protein
MRFKDRNMMPTQKDRGTIPRGTVACLRFSVLILALAAPTVRADTIDTVLTRKRLVCGVSQGIPGFSARDASGRWKGFDVDFCRALSAAIFGEPDRVEYLPLSTEERFDALTSGKIDVLSRNSTWTMSRDVGQHLAFVGVSYYDGQSFMVRAERGLVSAMELHGVKVCVQSGTTTETNAANWFRQQGLSNEIVRFPTLAALLAAYATDHCDAFSADRSALAAERMGFDQPDAHVILPEVISKEPLGPAVRKEDTAWADVVRWVLFALINAEEQGHARANFTTGTPTLAAVPVLSERLPRDWYGKTIAEVGNYAEVFERNLGKGTPLGIERGVNALWTQGGLLYAPPLH